MGRFFAIVIFLVVIALLVNRAMQGPEGPAKQEQEVAQQAPGEAAPAEEAAAEETPAEETPAEETPAEETPAAPSEQAEANVAAEPTTSEPETIPPSESASADVLTPEPQEQSEPEAQAKPEAQAEPAAPAQPETILLGTGELLDGIPGDGQLTTADIEAWLADPKNHVVLEPELPLGLAAGAAEIQGIDENPLTRAKIELGRQLYFDPRLSSDGTISCASCHDPAFGYAKDTQFGVGVGGQQGGRNSPVAYNRILSGPQFWDGRAASLEEQAIGPIANPIEMSNTHEACIETVRGIDGYVKQFEAVFTDGLNIENVGKAIASFERAIVTNPAPWDYYQQLATFEKSYADDLEYIKEEQAKEEPDLESEDLEVWNQYRKLQEQVEAHPISDSAIRGGQLFFSDKAGCTACHLGVNFTDEKYHNLGVGMDVEEPDLGRFVETNVDKDRGAFKTPTCRNVSLTAPYMHDGSQKTLEEVVEWYAKGGHPNQWLSENVKKLDLTEQDKKDLVAFMAEGLLSEFPPVEPGRLPE